MVLNHRDHRVLGDHRDYYGLWFMVYGLWFTFYVLRFMVYVLRFTFYVLRFTLSSVIPSSVVRRQRNSERPGHRVHVFVASAGEVYDH